MCVCGGGFFAEVIKNPKTKKLSWIQSRVSFKERDRGRFDTQRKTTMWKQSREEFKDAVPEDQMMKPQVKECWQVPKVGRGKK